VTLARVRRRRKINPDTEHLVGDMRALRLGRTYDAVLIHDAICYMTTKDDLRAAMTTAFEHLRPRGAAVFEPDFVRETFQAGTDHGGEEGPHCPTADKVARFAISSGGSDPIPPTRRTRSTTHSCSVMTTARLRLARIGTSRACSPGRSGWICSPTSDSRRSRAETSGAGSSSWAGGRVEVSQWRRPSDRCPPPIRGRDGYRPERTGPSRSGRRATRSG
jgi:hypothetical protein